MRRSISNNHNIHHKNNNQNKGVQRRPIQFSWSSIAKEYHSDNNNEAVRAADNDALEGDNYDFHDDDDEDFVFYDGEYNVDLTGEGKQREGKRQYRRFRRLRKGIEGVSTRLKSSVRGMLGITPPEEDMTWFEPTRQKIIDKYKDIKEEMLAELEANRRRKPGTITTDADQLLENALFKEMQAEIRTTRNEMRLVRFREFEETELRRVGNQDLSDVEMDDRVREIIDNARKSQEREKALQDKQEDFAEFQKRAVEEIKNKGVEAPKEGEDINDWVMRRLEDTLLTDEDMMDEDRANEQMDKITELRGKIDLIKERPKAPESYAEYKMQLELAESIKNEEEAGGKLDEWKEFLEFQQHAIDALEKSRETTDLGTAADKERAAKDVVADLNRNALKALEDLRSSGGGSTELEEAIDELKSLGKERNFLDDKFVRKQERQKQQEQVEQGPVDVEDIFPRFTRRTGRRSQRPRQRPTTARDGHAETSQTRNKNKNDEDEEGNQPWFLSSNGSTGEEDDTPPPPPNTAFFSGMDQSNSPPEQDAPSTKDDDDEEAASETLLGSYEDQKMKNVFRKAGATTKEEQVKLKEGYDDFQQFQDQMADMYGLNVDDETFATSMSPEYDMLDDAMTADGDIDAEKILAQLEEKYSQPENAVLGADTPNKKPVKDTKQYEEELKSMYRSNGDASTKDVLSLSDDDSDSTVSNVSDGGVPGTGEEEEEETQEDEAPTTFEEFAQFQADMLAKQDGKGKLVTEDPVAEQANGDGEEPEKPPTVVRRRSRGGDRRFSAKEEEEVVEEEPKEEPPVDTGFLGTEFANGTGPKKEGQKDETDPNYEKRIIDSDGLDRVDMQQVLRRNRYEYDDYEDEYESYPVRNMDVDLSVYFESKSRLLQQDSVDVAQLEELMNLKDSLEFDAIPVNRKRKVETPFQEFGAVFRLEGALVDMSAVNEIAWGEVAKAHSYRAPTREEIKQASVMRPDDAIRRVFLWTDNDLDSRKIADTHQSVLRMLFDCESTGLADRGSLGIDFADTTSEEAPVSVNVTALTESELEDLITLVPDSKRWVNSLQSVEVSCGLVSYLDQDIVSILLRRVGLAESFPVDNRVTSTTSYPNESVDFLGAALRIDRRPRMCVVFDCTPEAVRFAHDIDMKIIGVVGVHPAYELVGADTTALDYDLLTAMNVRRLFSDDNSRDPLPEEADQTPITRRKIVKTTYWDPTDDDDDDEEDDDGSDWDQSELSYSYEDRLDRALRDPNRQWYKPDGGGNEGIL